MSTAEAWAASVAKEETPSIVAPIPPLLLPEVAAAELLGVSRRTVYGLEKRGVLKSVRIGARKLYSVAMLKEFAERGSE